MVIDDDRKATPYIRQGSSPKEIEIEQTCKICGKVLRLEDRYLNPCPDCLSKRHDSVRKRFERRDIDTLKFELEIESDTQERLITYPNAADLFGRGWEDYSIEIFGIGWGRYSELVIPLELSSVESFLPFSIEKIRANPWLLLPFPLVRFPEDPDLIVEPCQFKVFIRDSPIHWELRLYSHGVTRIALRGLENVKSKKDFDKAWKAHKLIREIANQGRREGTTKVSIKEFSEVAPKAFKQFYDREEKDPADWELASEIEYLTHKRFSERTLYRYLEKSFVTMQRLREEAMKL